MTVQTALRESVMMASASVTRFGEQMGPVEHIMAIVSVPGNGETAVTWTANVVLALTFAVKM